MKNQGFLLIEIVIYIGLFSIMIGGLLVSASLLIQNSYESDNKLITGEEMNFVIQKLNWVLADATSLTTAEDGRSLYITNLKIYSEEIIFTFDEVLHKIDLRTDNEGLSPITTLNVSVLNTVSEPTKFIKIEASNGSSMGVSIFLNIDGQSIHFNKYLKYDSN